MKKIFLFIMTFCLANCISLGDFENDGGKRYALVYGISDYETVSDLMYPLNDALAMNEKLLLYGFDVVLRTNSQVTKNAISNDIADKISLLQPEDYLLFYFAGHGYSNSSSEYIVPYEGVLSSPEVLLDSRELANWLAVSGTDKVCLIFDHCFSGGMIASNSQFVVLTASRKDELAWEFDTPIEHGIFTYYILKGLLNKNADVNMDGRITLSELYFYAYPRVVNYIVLNVGDERQHPQFLGTTNTELVIIE